MTSPIGPALFERIWKQHLTTDVCVCLFNKIFTDEHKEVVNTLRYHNIPDWAAEHNVSVQPIVDWLQDLLERLLPSVCCRDGLIYDADPEIHDIFFDVCRQAFLERERLKAQ